ncbi:MAG: SIS domain-containing protein [Chloroflexi bacterium]|nr:SIS domain-containing protein [Chloroflexota bacterium]
MSETYNFHIDPQIFIQGYLADFQQLLDQISVESISRFIDHVEGIYHQDRTIFIIGNGGSAATASHLSCDLGKTVLGRAPFLQSRRLRVISLTDNMPLITAWANDEGYEHIFAEQIKASARPGDMIIAISGSGNSPNIVKAVQTARDLRLKTIALLGFDGGQIRQLVDDYILVSSSNYGFIEDVHMIVGHLITAHLKQRFANGEMTQVDQFNHSHAT